MGTDEKNLIITIKNYAKVSGTTSKKIVKEITEDLEDLIDAKIAEKAYQEHLKNPKTTSHEEVMREFGLK